MQVKYIVILDMKSLLKKQKKDKKGEEDSSSTLLDAAVLAPIFYNLYAGTFGKR
jgi:hypothetical protein